MIRSKNLNCGEPNEQPGSPNRSLCSENPRMSGRDQSLARLPGGIKLWNLIKILCALSAAIFTLDYVLSSEFVLPEHRRQPIPIDDQITVVMNTFKRNDMMAGNTI